MKNTDKSFNKSKKLSKVISLILSYLDAKESKTVKNYSNFIWPNNGKARTNLVGRPQFSMSLAIFDKKGYVSEDNTFDIRVEDFITGLNTVTLLETRARELENAKTGRLILCFTDGNVCYITRQLDWMKGHYTRKEIPTKSGKFKIVREFNLTGLLQNGSIIGLFEDSGKLIARSGTNVEIKDLHYYEDVVSDTENCAALDFDPRESRYCYYSFGTTSRYTNNAGTLSGIAKFIAGHTENGVVNNVYSKLKRALDTTEETGKAYPAKFKLTEDEKSKYFPFPTWDPSIFDGDNLVVYLSSSDSFDVIESAKPKNKTENMEDYQKEYYSSDAGKLAKLKNKIRNYLKRHNGEFNPKWTPEEVEIAKELVKNMKF